MKQARPTILLALFALIALPPLAAAGEKEELVLKIMDRSGMTESLDNVSGIVDENIKQLRAESEDGKAIDVVAREMREAFAGKKLKQAITAALLQDYHREHYSGALEQYNSPMGRKMVKMEEDSTQPGYEKQLQAYAQNLSENPPSNDRIRLISELDQASGATEAMLTVQMGFLRGMILATAMMEPEAERLSEAQMEQVLANIEQRARQSITQQNMVIMLFVYREASDEELKQFTSLYKDPHLAWTNDRLIAATAQAFNKAGTEVAEGMKEAAL